MPDTPSTPGEPSADGHGELSRRREGGGGSAAQVPASRRAARAARAETSERPASPRAEPSRSTASSWAHAPAASSTRIPDTAGTLDDLFTGSHSIEEVGTVPPTNKRRRRLGGWIAFGIVVALIGGVAAAGSWAWNEYGSRVQDYFAGATVDDYAEGAAHDAAQITIAAGDAGPQVSQKLFDAGVTKTPTSLYDHMIENSIAFTFQPGVYQLQLEMTSPAVLEALRDPANKLENTAQLREGLTVESSIQAISEQMGIPLEQLQAAVADPAAYGVAAPRLEGWLFPATYTFDPDVTATDVIGRMVARTVESLDAAGVPPQDRQRILTIASIIEREARTPDFGKVSRVIQNRLDQGMRLQMDSTAQYGYGELHTGSASTSEQAQFDANEWNTYVIDGLPATPIANPGDAAIAAAMHPEEGPWLFFVTVNLDTGETVFTTNADDHQAAVDQWIAWCQDNPDSGC